MALSTFKKLEARQVLRRGVAEEVAMPDFRERERGPVAPWFGDVLLKCATRTPLGHNLSKRWLVRVFVRL